MFFPGLHLGPRACSPQANLANEEGARGRSEVCLSHTEENERGLGLTCAEEAGKIWVLPAVYLSYFK